MHGHGVEGDARRGFRVNAHAHVAEVVNRVEPVADVGPHLGLELVVAVADLEGDVGVDVGRDARLEELLAGLVDGQERAVAGVGDGLAVAQRRAGELDGKGSAVSHHGFRGFRVN